MKNRRVLITGYEGFLGSNLTKKLVNLGAKIAGLDLKTFRKETILSKKDLTKIKVISGNVSNYKLLNKILKKYKIEFIFHLAACALVEDCQKFPLIAFDSNIRGTWSILEASRQISTLTGIIIASSDKAYGIKVKLPYQETDCLAGSHPYDVSKSCADLIGFAYYRSFGLPVAITRCGNIYGPGDYNFTRIIPDAVMSALTNKTLVIRSDGQFTRDYIYVDDVIDGYLLLAQKLSAGKLFGEAFNFSNEQPLSVIKLVKKIYKLVGRNPNYKIKSRTKYEIMHQFLSSGKAKKILGWKPKFSLDQGLVKTINWYKKL